MFYGLMPEINAFIHLYLCTESPVIRWLLVIERVKEYNTEFLCVR